jgi:2-deoxy-D-gluconate 3-dehydrogenase
MGRAIARAFAEEGADVAILDRDPDHFPDVQAEIEALGQRAMTLELDITETKKLPDAFASVLAELGSVDILMNNAGVSPGVAAVHTTEQTWDLAMDVNAKAMFFLSIEAGRHFLAEGKRGKVINTCSTLSVVADPDCAAYCASKGAALQITRALACEWAAHGINVNGIAPTLVPTDMSREQLEDPAYVDRFMRKLPAGVLPAPANIAEAAVFLAGPYSDFIHGHMLPVDSGELVL